MALSAPPQQTGSFALGPWLKDLWVAIGALYNTGTAWVHKAVDGGATDTYAETSIPRDPIAGVVTKVEYLPESGGLTPSHTTNPVLGVAKRAPAGGSAVTTATPTTNVASGDWTQWVRKNFGTLTNATLLSTDTLIFSIPTKNSAGVIVPAGKVIVTIAGA